MSDRTPKQRIEFLRELISDLQDSLRKTTCPTTKAGLRQRIVTHVEKIKELEKQL